MINRVRDKARNFRPLEVITFPEWSDIEDRATRASAFINESNLAYTMMRDDLEEAQEIILTNRVQEVREVRWISNLISKIFITPKQEQLDELVGQLKYIRGYLAELQSWIDRKAILEKQEADGTIIIRRSEEESNEAV